MLATACFDAEMDLLVREDGSGSITVTMRIGESALEIAALAEGGGIEDLCQQMLDDMDFNDVLGLGAVDSSADAVVTDGNCVVTMTSMWSTGDSERVLTALAEDGGPSIRRLDNDGWRFELEMGSLADDELSVDDLELATAMGFDFPTLAISVTLPGDAVEHNADSANRSKYSWDIDLRRTDQLPEALYAETAPAGGLSPAAIGAIVAGILLALAALVTLRRHQEAKAAESSAGDAERTAAAANDSTASEPSDGDEAGPAQM